MPAIGPNLPVRARVCSPQFLHAAIRVLLFVYREVIVACQFAAGGGDRHRTGGCAWGDDGGHVSVAHDGEG